MSNLCWQIMHLRPGRATTLGHYWAQMKVTKAKGLMLGKS